MIVAALLLPVAMGTAQDRALAAWWDRAPTYSSKFYRIRTDLPRAEAQRLSRHLDAVHEAYLRQLGSLNPRAPEALDVLIFHRRDDYRLTMRARFGVDATGTGGMFVRGGTGSALAFWTEGLPRHRLYHVIQHEGFHQFASSRFGNDLPLWVNEGLAEYFGTAVLDGTTFIAGQANARVLEQLHDGLERGAMVPFRRMLAMSHEAWADSVRSGDAALRYHQAWSMVHFLINGEGGRYRKAFEAYLRAMNRGHTPDVALARSLELGDELGRFDPEKVAAFEARWRAEVERWRPGAFITALERIEFLAEGALALHARGERPTSLEGLRDAMRAIGFTDTVYRHGGHIDLTAADDELFAIPAPLDGEAEPPVFVAEPPSLRGLTRRERYVQEQHPAPPTIRTEHLTPRGLRVEWRRDADGRVSGYLVRIITEKRPRGGSRRRAR